MVDAYQSIAADMLDNPSITFMRDSIIQYEPLRTVPIRYLPGVDPSQPYSFPGPHVGMYGALPNGIVYCSYTGSGNWLMEEITGNDKEFPAIALERWQSLNINWQEFIAAQMDYEIMRTTNLNPTVPANPPALQLLQGWSIPTSDSKDNANDDLFPNLAHKKAVLYHSAIAVTTSGYDEV
jgi:hypothetical protein